MESSDPPAAAICGVRTFPLHWEAYRLLIQECGQTRLFPYGDLFSIAEGEARRA